MHLFEPGIANLKFLFRTNARRACTTLLPVWLSVAAACGELSTDSQAGMVPGDVPAQQQAATPGGPDRVPDTTNWPLAECDEVYDLRAHGAGLDTPLMVSAGGETHPQVSITPPWGSTKVQAIAFKPITDNTNVLYNWTLYKGLTMLTSWAPGDNGAHPYPADVGMDMPNGNNTLRLDMHYVNTQGTRSEPDRSGVSVCIVKGAHLRAKSAAVTMSLTSFGPILAPANNRDFASTGRCTVKATEPVTLIEANPHAQKYAKHVRFVVRKANGEEIVMHDQPFKLGEQGRYPLDPPIVVQTGDVITTTCTYDNTTSRSITFGESSENEQCFNFAVYYPKGALYCSPSF